MEAVENEFVKFWIDGEIMYGEYKPHITIDLEAAKKVVQARLSLAQNKDYPLMGFMDGVSGANKEARDYFSTGDGVRGMKKMALLTTSPISRMVGNFYLTINKPTIPTKIFTTKEDALKWLKSE